MLPPPGSLATQGPSVRCFGKTDFSWKGEIQTQKRLLQTSSHAAVCVACPPPRRTTGWETCPGTRPLERHAASEWVRCRLGGLISVSLFLNEPVEAATENVPVAATMALKQIPRKIPSPGPTLAAAGRSRTEAVGGDNNTNNLLN